VGSILHRVLAVDAASANSKACWCMGLGGSSSSPTDSGAKCCKRSTTYYVGGWGGRRPGGPPTNSMGEGNKTGQLSVQCRDCDVFREAEGAAEAKKTGLPVPRPVVGWAWVASHSHPLTTGQIAANAQQRGEGGGSKRRFMRQWWSSAQVVTASASRHVCCRQGGQSAW
jgi:hypothetical protein